jgi:hypothetical protein
MVWVLWCISTCPMRLIGLVVPFRSSTRGRKVLAPTSLGCYYGAGALHDVMGNLAGTDADVGNNLPHKALHNLRRTVG